ncbi:hypothetical protein KOW79_005809 [Hemibagrus wyckioides]|uniref:TRIM8/14/16/25/29/45/65 coiled-coil region domain-containing protein n=1 Tax=Hemibagrus wyckioides TaxID=337641 RepID=A0A9D3NZH8_9TELE|nr:hypothetical protein KOW79_005809 [Hemibagrus wyckioides]
MCTGHAREVRKPSKHWEFYRNFHLDVCVEKASHLYSQLHVIHMFSNGSVLSGELHNCGTLLSELKEDQMKFQQRIQEKQKKVQELKQAVNTIKLSAQTAVDDSERIFAEMISSMEKKRSEGFKVLYAFEQFELGHSAQSLQYSKTLDAEVFRCPLHADSNLISILRTLANTLLVEMMQDELDWLRKLRQLGESQDFALLQFHLSQHNSSAHTKCCMLITWCLEHYPEKRPIFQEILNKWFTGELQDMEQSELKEEQMKFQQRIQEKQKKVQELKQTVNTIKLSAQTAVDDSEMIFTEMISSMEKKRSESDSGSVDAGVGLQAGTPRCYQVQKPHYGGRVG